MSSEEKQEDDAGGNETNVDEDNGNSIAQQSQNVRQTQARAPKRPNSDGQTNGTAAKNTCTETNGASGSERHDEESSDEEEPTQPEPVLFSDISDSDSSPEPTENETEWGILLRVDNRIVLQGRPPATVPANPSVHYERTFVRNATSLRVIVQHIMLDEVNGTMTPGPIVPPQPTIPPPIPPLPSMSATQRNMWMRQQVDAENRRRRATANVVANTSLPPTNFASTSTTDSEPVTRAAAARGEDWIGAYINVSSFRRMLANVLRYDDSGMVTPGSISLPSHNCLAVTLIHRCTVVFPYSAASGGDQRSCVICISEYQEGQDVRRLPCMHVFHRECVDRWMLDQLRCPICRYDILERAAELNRDENNEPSTSDDGTNTQNVE